MLLTIVIFILLLTVLVLIHEAGHYFVAKKLGIKVEEFGFGLPPRAIGIKRGETIYSLNWLPIGGFVKLYGEDDAGAGRITKDNRQDTSSKKDIGRAFFARSAWQRAAVVFAGVFMNSVLAAVLFYIFFLIANFQTVLPCMGNPHLLLVHTVSHCDVVIREVSKDSPAAALGIKVPSKILAINGKPINSTEDLQDVINSNKGEKITVTWEDLSTKKDMTGTAVPRVHPPKGEGSFGVGFDAPSVMELSYDTPVEKALSGIVHPINLMIFQFVALGQLFHQAEVSGNVAPIAKNVSGPIGIAAMVGLIVHIPDTKELILQVLNLAGLLSISLAFFNVLPIPALDGGRLFFILIEAIFGVKVNPKFEAAAHTIGMMVLLGLLALITYKDLGQFVFGNGFQTP